MFRGHSFDRRDRWKREPSHSPILILRKRRSASRTRRSVSKTPPRLTELGMNIEICICAVCVSIILQLCLRRLKN